MPGVLKNLMARLKRRRRWRSSKREQRDMPTEQLAQLSLVQTPAEGKEGPSAVPTFRDTALDFRFDTTAFTSENTIPWPGPSYDESALFAPGTFDKPRHLKRVPKRKTSKRTLSLDERYTGPPKPLVRGEQKQKKQQTVTTKRIPMPYFFGKPPARDPPIHLLNLPGEIRNQVYRLLYVLEDPIIAQFRIFMRPKKGRTEDGTTQRRLPREPALALVCKQLQREVMSLFYAENTFVFRKKTFPFLTIQKPPVMTNPENIEKWMPKFGFGDSLTRLQVEFSGRTSTHRNITFIYTFKKLPGDKNKYTVSANVQDFNECCICAEDAMIRIADDVVEDAGKDDNLLTLLKKFTMLRRNDYWDVQNTYRLPMPCNYTPVERSCTTCKLDHLVETAIGT